MDLIKVEELNSVSRDTATTSGTVEFIENKLEKLD